MNIAQNPNPQRHPNIAVISAKNTINAANKPVPFTLIWLALRQFFILHILCESFVHVINLFDF